MPRKAVKDEPDIIADLERTAFDALAALISRKLEERGAAAATDTQRPALAHMPNDVAEGQHTSKALHVSLGKIMYSWSRRAPYIDSTGRPKALPVLGPRPSLTSLVKEHADSCDVDEVLAALGHQGLIRPTRNGSVLPTANVAHLKSNRPEVACYVTDTVARLVSTVIRNLQRGPKDAALIERSAVVRDLPADLEREFIEFANEQGELFVETMNEWLESRRSGNASSTAPVGGYIAAGVQVFSFVSDLTQAPLPHRATRDEGSSRHLSSEAPP